MGARERLVRIVQGLERLELAKQTAADDLRAGFVEAARAGYDPSTLKAVLKLRKLSPEERKERRALEAIYMATLGMLEGAELPEEARRRLDEPDQAPQPERRPGRGAKAAGPRPAHEPPAPAAPVPKAPAQARMPLKEPQEARADGRAAAEAGARIYDNPFPAGDPCRAAWDEGWCEKKKSHGMDTPAAYQRRPKPPEGKPDGKTSAPGDGEKKGAA